MTLDELLVDSDTRAFVIVQDDRVVFERYPGDYERDTLHTSFSVSKSVTSLLVGAALMRGVLPSPDESVTRWLPELAERDPRFARITLRHLLEMKSGIAFIDSDAPWGDKPRAYYHPWLRKVVLEDLEVDGEPGVEFIYNTFNPILLGLVLERATDRSVAELCSDWLWRPLGAEFAASWSLDSEADAMAKMESGFNARAIDLARLGRLVLDGGVTPDGQRLVGADWIAACAEPVESSRVARLGANVFYRLGWWVHADTRASTSTDTDRHAMAGWGHLGQFLYVFPEQRLIIVRYGNEMGDVAWPYVFQQIVERLRRQS